MSRFVIFIFLFVNATISTSSQPNNRLLEGVKLSCCTLVEFPVVFRDPTSHYKFQGIAFEYLKQLEHRLGFTCSSMFEYKGSDTSFTRMVKHFFNCSKYSDMSDPVCRCQLGVGGWGKTRDRAGHVLFLPEFLRYDTDMLTNRDNIDLKTNNHGFFVNAFSTTVWILILVLFVLFTLVRSLDARFSPPPETYQPLSADHNLFGHIKHFLLKSHLLYRLRKAMTETAAQMSLQGTSHNEEKESNSTRQWFMSFIIGWIGLVFLLIYEAFVTASLVEYRVTADFRTREDIIHCAIDVKDICITKGGAEENIWRNSFSKAPCMRGEMPNFLNSYDDIMEAVLENKKCKYVVGSLISSRSSKHCSQVVTVGEPLFWYGLSAIMPLNANKTLYEILRNTTFDLVEQGKIMTLKQFNSRKGECVRHETRSLSLDRLSYFFIAAFSYIFLMFIVMIVNPQNPRKKIEEKVQLEFEEYEKKMSARGDITSNDWSEISFSNK